jgi:predicted GIY-YIG superfamily endonuclease
MNAILQNTSLSKEDLNKKMVVYIATSPSGRVYIGKTMQKLKTRISAHIYNASHRKEGAFCNAINKYGIENIKWGILEECDSYEELNDREEYWMTKYNSVISGYNIAFGVEPKYRSRGYSSKIKGRKYDDDYIIPMMESRGCKWIGVYDINGKFLAIFRKIKHAKEFTGVKADCSIQSVLSGKYRHCLKYIFRRIDLSDAGKDISIPEGYLDQPSMRWFNVYKDDKFLYKSNNQRQCALSLGICPATVHQLLIKKIKYNEMGYNFEWCEPNNIGGN